MPLLQNGIVMWSGIIANIPQGWALCDGTNGTIDLKDRFVIGAGSTYSVGATGGSANAVVVSHNHSVSGSLSSQNALHNHNTEAGNHTNVSFSGFGGNPTSGNSESGRGSDLNNVSHAHGLGVSTEGESGTDKNLPPYYSLAFIQQIG